MVELACQERRGSSQEPLGWQATPATNARLAPIDEAISFQVPGRALQVELPEPLRPACGSHRGQLERHALQEKLPEPLRLRAGSRCVRGGYRANNEDKCYADVTQGIFLVADGMGGRQGGAEASRYVVKAVPRVLQAATRRGKLDDRSAKSVVERALQAARRGMNRLARRCPDCRQMGATMASIIINGDTAHVANVGDCRAYLIRGSRIRRLTRDQTFVQTLVDAGVLTAREAQQSSYRHVVLNAVSTKDLEPPFMQTVELQAGDRLLLATDGLTGVLDDELIAQRVADGSPQEAADALVLEALRRDSHDNVSCVVIKVLPDRVHPS